MFNKYFKLYKKEIVFGPIFKLIEAMFELLIPFYMIKVVDEGIKNNDSDAIYKYIFIMVLLTVFGYLSSMICQYFAAKAGFGIGTSLRDDLFSHINTLSYKELDQNSSSFYINTITYDIEQVQSSINWFIRLGIRAPFLVIFSTILAFLVDVQIGLIFTLVSFVILIFLIVIITITIKHYNNLNKDIDSISLLAKEGKRGARIIRAFSNQEKEINKFETINNNIYKKANKINILNSLLNPINYLLINFAIIIIVYISGYKVYNGTITQGETMALYSWLTYVLMALIIVINLSILFTKGFSSYLRIKSVFELKNSQKIKQVNKIDSDYKIVIKNASFYYQEKSKVIDNINLNIKEKEFIGIIGKTGSGKSTFINLLSRNYDLTEGNIYINNIDINSIEKSEITKLIHIAGQNANLVSGSIKDNLLRVNPNLSEEEIKECIINSSADFVYNLKDTINYQVSQNGNNFSGGEKQRLVIARALASNSEILVFDDTNSALDYKTDLIIRRNLRKLNKTVIIISQRISSIKDCDKIVILENGRIDAIGSHDYLVANNEFYKDIFESQGGKLND